MIVAYVVVIALIFNYLVCKLLYIVDIEVTVDYTVLSLGYNHLAFFIE